MAESKHIFLIQKLRHMRFQFMKGNQGTDRIMPSGTGKTQKQRQVGVQFLIVTRKLEQGISIIILVKVTVPSPGSIRIRIMTWFIRIRRSIAGDTPAAMSSGIGMGMDDRAITGKSQIIGGYQPMFHRRDKDDKTEKFLKPCFEVKGDILPIHNAVGNYLGYFGLRFSSFLPFAFWPFRFSAVPGSGKEFLTAVEIRGSGRPRK